MYLSLPSVLFPIVMFHVLALSARLSPVMDAKPSRRGVSVRVSSTMCNVRASLWKVCHVSIIGELAVNSAKCLATSTGVDDGRGRERTWGQLERTAFGLPQDE